jgi:hypothetical protein
VRSVRFALVLVLALELAVWEAFLVAARPLGEPLPLAAALAVVGNLGLGLLGARVLGHAVGAALPGVLWLVVVFALGLDGPGGDKVVIESGRGVALLLLGALAAAVATGVADAQRKRTTPDGVTRR